MQVAFVKRRETRDQRCVIEPAPISMPLINESMKSWRRQPTQEEWDAIFNDGPVRCTECTEPHCGTLIVSCADRRKMIAEIVADTKPVCPKCNGSGMRQIAPNVRGIERCDCEYSRNSSVFHRK